MTMQKTLTRDGRSKHPWYFIFQQHKRNVNCPWSDFHEFRRWCEDRDYDPAAGDKIILHHSRLYGFAPRIRKPGKQDPISTETIADEARAGILRTDTDSIITERIRKHWLYMMDRTCRKSDPLYHRIGGAGVRVCPEWHEFDVFLVWAKERGGGRERTHLLRRDMLADYSPSNCLWG
jgi:hypothetical protein